MRGEVNIGGKAVMLEANAATPIRFKGIFHADLLKLLDHTQAEPTSAMDVVAQLAFTMKEQAAGADMPKVTEEDFVRWMEGLEPDAFFNVDTLKAILGVYNAQAAKSVTSKKKAPKSPEK